MSTETSITSARRQCRHIFPDGHRCGSPCLRKEEFCFYHHTTRRPTRRQLRDSAAFPIAIPDNRAAVQLALGEVLSRIVSAEIDPRRAALLLYGLQIASTNLPRQPIPKSAPKPSAMIENVVDDPELGPIAESADFHPAGTDLNLEQILMRRWAQDEENRKAEQARLEQARLDSKPTEVQT